MENINRIIQSCPQSNSPFKVKALVGRVVVIGKVEKSNGVITAMC